MRSRWCLAVVACASMLVGHAARADEELPPLPPPDAKPAPVPVPVPVSEPAPPGVVPHRTGPRPAPVLKAAPPVTPPRPGPGAWKSFKAGASLVSSIPAAAVLDGVWSLSLQSSTQLIQRSWSGPFPFGSIGHYSTHLLYGTSWTVMLGLESLIVLGASGGKLEWLAEANYRVDWVLGYDVPACPKPGAMGGCGIGAGDFAFLSVRPLRSKWWYEVGGGWFQQRVANDELRTLGESTWVLTPFSAVREFKSNPDKPIAFRAFAGPGVYGGMHNANLHPTTRGREFVHPPWTELYPLDYGVGPGARVEGRVTYEKRWSLEAELVFAPLLLGQTNRRVSHDVAPLDFERSGIPVWRRATLGVAWFDPEVLPFKTTLAFFAAELSDRPVEKIGYRGAIFRFDVPLKVPSD